MRSSAFLVILAIAKGAFAVKPYCGYACNTQTEDFTFKDCPKHSDADCGTTDTPAWTGTLALCIQDYCHGSIKEWRSALGDYTELAALAQDSYVTILNNATAFAADGPVEGKKAIQPLPFHFTQAQFDNAYRTTWADSGAVQWYTSIMAYVLLILTLAVIVPASLMHFFFSRRSKRTLHKSGTSTASALLAWPRKWFFLPPLFKKHNAHRPSFLGFSVTIPTRFETFCIVIYILINALGCGLGIDPYKDNLDYKVVSQYTVRTIADKTGIMCIYNLPLMVLFAGRNNVLISLTGIPFSTFNIFHRMIGRVVVVEAIIHSIGYLVREKYHKKKDLASWFNKSTYAIWGAVAALCGVIILFQGTHALRRLSYEIFLVLHIAMAAFFMIGAWYHIWLQDYRLEGKWPNYLNWILAAVVLWGFDRFVRVLKIAWFSFRWSKKDGFQVSRAALRVLPGGFIELSVKMARDWDYTPGQYCFVHLPGGLRYLQSHPFTLLAYDSPDTGFSPSSSQDNLDEKKEGAFLKDVSAESGERRLKMMVRPQKGITATLAKLCDQNREPVVFVEGPYGNPFNLPLSCYDNVTFVSGGIGFTAVYPHVKPALSGQHQQLHWICIIRSSEEAEAFRPYLAQVAGSPNLKISLYVTSEEGPEVARSYQDRPLPGLTLTEGHRPNVPSLLEKDVETAGTMAVVACGPGRLLDDVRRGVCDLISTKREHIELFSEAFEW